MKRLLYLALACAVTLGLSGCFVVREARREEAVQRHQEQEVSASLARYRQLVVSVDADRLADMFETTGELSHGDEPPHVGHDAILGFLKGFVAYKVEQYDLRAESTVVEGNAVVQNGVYSQTVLTPDGKTVQVAGTFRAEWVHEADGRWLLRRMHTMSPADANRR